MRYQLMEDSSSANTYHRLRWKELRSMLEIGRYEMQADVYVARTGRDAVDFIKIRKPSSK